MSSKVERAFFAAIDGNEAIGITSSAGSTRAQDVYAEDPNGILSMYEYWVASVGLTVDDYLASTSPIASGFAGLVRRTRSLREYLVAHGFDAAAIDRAVGGPRNVDQERFVHLVSLWLIDQKELLARVVLERSIVQAMDATGRAQMRTVLGDLKAQALEAERVRQNLDLVYRLAIEDLGPEWKGKSKSVDDLMAELSRRATRLRADADALAQRARPTEKHQRKEDHLRRQVAHLETVRLNLEFARAQALVKDNPTDLQPLLGDSPNVGASYALHDQRDLSVEAQDGRRRGAAKQVKDRSAAVRERRAALDPKIAKLRDDLRGQIERAYGELLPVLDRLVVATEREASLRAELMNFKPAVRGGSPAKTTTALLDELRATQRELRALRLENDRLTVAIAGFDARMQTLANTYTEQVSDEDRFEDEARRQLELLKTLPNVAQAMNVYCTQYDVAFPIFLYVGNMLAGDGTVLEGDDLVDLAKTTATEGAAAGAKATAKAAARTARDAVFKMPIFGMGMLDVEKCKAYDTGTLAISLKLGLSYGLDVGATEAKVGLALTYDGRLTHNDNREFATDHTFKVQVVGSAKIPKIIDISLKIDAYKKSGGYVFQDQYHWAAWMAEGWGRAIAKLRAADLYMSKHNVGPNEVPDRAALAAIDEMAANLFEHDPALGAVYDEIRFYLEQPVLRTKASEFFKGAAMELAALDDKLKAELAVDLGTTEVIVTRNEGGHSVAYVAHAESKNVDASVTYGEYTISFAYGSVSGDVRTMTNGTTATLSVSPLPPVDFWVKVFDIAFAPLVTGSESAGEKLWKVIKEESKYFFTKYVLKKYAKDYMAELEKAAEVGFVLSPGGWTLMFARTRLSFSKGIPKGIPKSIPVGVPGLALDFDATVTLDRTSDEVMGYHSTTYPRMIYVGLQRRLKHGSGRFSGSTTLRPEKHTGKKLWDEYAKKHKHQFWDLFVAIGNNEKVVMAEFARAKAGSEARALLDKCRAATLRGGYATPPIAAIILSSGAGFIPADLQVVQGLAVTAKTLAKTREEFESKLIEKDFTEILAAFDRWLAAELDAMEASEAIAPLRPLHPKKSKAAVLASDASAVMQVGDALTLERKTRKQRIACRAALEDQHQNYALAEFVLSVPLLPEKYWVPDSAASACMACNQVIRAGLFSTNKHHCRICGGVFCDRDSPTRGVPAWVSSSRVRVCPACATFIENGGLKALIDGRREPRATPAVRAPIVPFVPVQAPSRAVGARPSVGSGADSRASFSEVGIVKTRVAVTRTTEIWRVEGDDSFLEGAEGHGGAPFVLAPFAQGDNPVPRQNNGIWRQHGSVFAGLANHVHVPMEATGFCFLTALATYTNRSTRQIIDDFDAIALRLGGQAQSRWYTELQECMRGGVDPGEIEPILREAGLTARVVVFHRHAGSDTHEQTFGAAGQAGAVSVVVLHRSGHYDLLVPRAEAESRGLSYDGSQYVAKGFPNYAALGRNPATGAPLP